MQTVYTDVLVIGAGLAGERVAIEAAQAGFSAICLSLVPARHSHSAVAQGGMQAALGNCAGGEGDSPDAHFADTVRGSDWGCDQEVAQLFAERAPVEIRQLAHWGVPWSRVTPGAHTHFRDGAPIEREARPENAGLIDASGFGGTDKWRACRAFDGTGHGVLFTVDNVCAKLGVEVHDKTEAIALIQDGEMCFGCVARCLRTGELRVYLSKASVIATGGFGRLFLHSTNAVISDGGGHILVLNTGLAPMGNMEAVQFHPTALVPTDILIGDACRDHGGTLLDANKERFLNIREPGDGEPAGRDEVCRRMVRHMRQGGGVASPHGEHLWLDIRHLGAERIASELPAVRELCARIPGIDPARQLIPVRPAQHYGMGGVRTGKDGHVPGLKGLFAVGEAACWDLHGFNRLGGNSLAEAVVAGGMVGRKIAEFLQGAEVTFNSAVIDDEVKRQTERIGGLIRCKAGTENVYKVRQAMRQALDEGANVLRTGTGLAACVASLRETLDRARRVGLKSNGLGVNPELSAALKIEGQVKLALMVALGALKRTESRGCHHREDFPARDDGAWLTRTLATWKNPDDDLPTLEYEPASPAYPLPPDGRGHGDGQTGASGAASAPATARNADAVRG